VESKIRHLQSFFAERESANRRASRRCSAKMRAIVHCRDRFQSVVIRDISPSGMKLENVLRLMPGDVVTIELLSSRSLVGTVVWSVASFCGIEFETPLVDNDPLIWVE
jgi:hypothetical protein